MRPRGEESVYVTVAGKLEELFVTGGDIVEKGDQLARFSNVDLELRISELAGRETKLQSKLTSLQRERFSDPAAGMEIGTIEESLKSVQEQLEKQRQYQRELVLVAPRAGVVLPPETVKKKGDVEGMLPNWSGSAISKRNLGATYAEGTILCMVGDASQFEAVMLVDQAEVEFIARGQRIGLKLDAFPFETFTGTVDDIAENHVDAGSERLSVKSGGSVAMTTDEMGREVPMSTSYEVLMHLDDQERVLTAGMLGNARISVGSRTVGQWLWRIFWTTFNFRL